jgi:hypothetical protein
VLEGDVDSTRQIMGVSHHRAVPCHARELASAPMPEGGAVDMKLYTCRLSHHKLGMAYDSTVSEKKNWWKEVDKAEES